MIDYVGDDIQIEEMPQGCIITAINSNRVIQVSSPKDAWAVIESLQKMLRVNFGVEILEDTNGK